jgi:hypothetical protein
LLGYYDELYTLHAKVSKRTQVRNLVDIIIHEWTQAVATNPRAKRNLNIALAKIGEWMQLLGILAAGTSKGGQSDPSNRQIKKLKRKVKALQKKDDKGGSKPGKQDEALDDFLPKAVLDAIRQAGGDNGGKYVRIIFSCEWNVEPG